jgi:hypothetical protein
LPSRFGDAPEEDEEAENEKDEESPDAEEDAELDELDGEGGDRRATSTRVDCVRGSIWTPPLLRCERRAPGVAGAGADDDEVDVPGGGVEENDDKLDEAEEPEPEEAEEEAISTLF